MNDNWLRSLVWTDYRLAVLIAVILPIILLIWAAFKRKEAIVRLLIIYWRVASLLMITVYLMIPGWSLAFISSLAAKLLIPISLWFWVDLNEEIKDLPQTALKLAVTSWRWATTFYCIIGVILTAPFVSCAFSESQLASPFCQVWLEAPRAYRLLFHDKPGNEGFLGFMGMVGLTIYVLYLAYFVFIRLGKQGRSALEH